MVLAIVTVTWALLLPWAFPLGAPAWAWILTCLVAAIASIGTIPAMNLSDPWQVILQPNDLWLGGTMAGRTIAYERVHLIKLQKPGYAHRLILRVGRRDLSIVLSLDDAVLCFNTLRKLCGQAAAVGLNNEHYPPMNLEYVDAGHKSLRSEARFQLRELVGATIVCALMGIGASTALWFGYGAIPAWAFIMMSCFAVVMALGALGGVLGCFQVQRGGSKRVLSRDVSSG